MTSKRFFTIVLSALLVLSALSVGMAVVAEDAATMEPAMTIVADAEVETLSSYASNVTVEAAADVSPIGKAYKVVNPSAENIYPEFVLNAPAPTGEFAGLAFWVKAPDKAIDFNFSLRGNSSVGANAPYSYTLVAEDGTLSEKSSESNLGIPANFTGWVILPKESMQDAWIPEGFYAFGFTYDPRYFLDTTFYLDSFGFYTDQEALIASVSPAKPEEPPVPDVPTQNTDENKEMWVINGFDGENIRDYINWDNGTATIEKTDASPDGNGLSITPPKDSVTFEVCPKVNIPGTLVEQAIAGEYTGLCYWYKAPLETSGNPGLNYFEEKTVDDTYYRVCYGYNADTEYYTIDKDGVYKECYGVPLLNGFEGWVFIPFDSFVRGWGNDAPGDIDFEPWYSYQLDITYNPKGEGTDGLAALYDDFAFYTNIEAVKEAFGAQDEELPLPPASSEEESNEESKVEEESEEEESKVEESKVEESKVEESKDETSEEETNPDTGVATLIPAALLLAAGAGAVTMKSRKRR